MNTIIKSFEETLFPLQTRWEYAYGNIANDASLIGETTLEKIRMKFLEKAPKLFPDFDQARPNPRIGVLSIKLPMPCDATCPSICYTDMMKWERSKSHTSFDAVLSLLKQAHQLGCKLVRIIGDGEPRLYPELPELCRWTFAHGMSLVIFTNGIALTPKLFESYATCLNVHYYVKLWSKDVRKQTKMVAPRVGKYRYVKHPQFGMVPYIFNEFWKIDSKRVGFQVMFSRVNYKDALGIVNGPTKEVPLLVEPFIPEGSGKEHRELIPVNIPTSTKDCEWPSRSSWLAVVNSFGMLQSGTFVPEGAKSIRDGRLAEVWSSIYVQDEKFFTSRYSEGCFCELERLVALGALKRLQQK